MKTKAKKVTPEFNISKALIVIEKDADLNDMFREKFGTDYKMSHALINSGTGIKASAEKYAKSLFEKIIVVRPQLLEQYNSLKLPVKEEVKPNKKKRWGLKAIDKDIADGGNKVKQIHRTAKKIQLLKKIFTKLEMRSFNERFTKKTLTDSELREIGGAIETFNKKMDSILKPKK